MIRGVGLIILALVSVVLVSCVETDSSDGSSSENPSSSSSGSVSSSSDSSSSTSSSSTSSSSEQSSSSSSSIDSIFDTIDAIYDANACTTSGFLAIKDSSFDPEGYEDTENGMIIGSSYPMGVDLEQSEVNMYHPGLHQTKVGGWTNVQEKNYYFSFDYAWIENDKKTVYVRTPKNSDGKFGCYRYELTSTDSTNIVATKVYR
jgi:cytoskeletal protein RodZ